MLQRRSRGRRPRVVNQGQGLGCTLMSMGASERFEPCRGRMKLILAIICDRDDANVVEQLVA